MKQNSGFSLIELLISMSLMVLISATMYAALNIFFNFWEKEYSVQSTHEKFLIYESAIREDVLLSSKVDSDDSLSVVLVKGDDVIRYDVDHASMTIKRNDKVVLSNIVPEYTFFTLDGKYLKYSAFIKSKSGNYGRKGLYAL